MSSDAESRDIAPPEGTAGEAGAGFGAILKRLGPASVLALIALVAPPLGGFLVLGFIDPIAAWLESHGDMGIWIYVGAFAVSAGLALLPTYSQSILGGWAFGLAAGVMAALGGFVGGAIVGYAIARPVASERVGKLIAEHPKWMAVRNALLGGGFWKTLGIVTLLRLPPNSPFAATNLVLASVRVPWLTYVIATAVGMSPRTAAAVWLGQKLHGDFSSMSQALEEGQPLWLKIGAVGVTIVVVVIVLVVMGHIANKALKRVTAG